MDHLSRRLDGGVKSANYYLESRPDIQALLDVRGRRVLDVGCAAGELGRALKQAGAREVMGIERDPTAAALAKNKLDAVLVGEVDRVVLAPAESRFDYIIFADVLEHLTDPWSVLASYRHYLKPGGTVVASIPNIRFYAVIARLLFNRWGYRESGILDSTHLRFFTLPTIREMFERAGYCVERIDCRYRLFEDQSRIGRMGALVNRLFCRYVAPLAWRHFFAFQYLVVARNIQE